MKQAISFAENKWVFINDAGTIRVHVSREKMHGNWLYNCTRCHADDGGIIQERSQLTEDEAKSLVELWTK